MEKRYTRQQRHRKLYKLAWLMNKQNKQLVPISKELIDCFEIAMADDEIDFLLKMGTHERDYTELCSLSGLSSADFKKFFETIFSKGFIKATRTKGDVEKFILHPIMVGWFEMYLAGGKETEDRKEFSRRVDIYFKSFKKFNFFPLRSLVNLNRRLITTNSSIAAIAPGKRIKSTRSIEIGVNVPTPLSEVQSVKSVNDLIETYADEGIALMHCFCRQWRKMVDQPCGFQQSAEACIGIGGMARYLVQSGIGRSISKTEAMDKLQETEEKGAVHLVYHERDDARLPAIGICNCCKDCCAIFGSYNRGIFPLAFKTHAYSEVFDALGCKACGQCLKYCPVNAIVMKADMVIINSAKCIGCGQCVFRCKQNVIKLVPGEREVILPLLKASDVTIANDAHSRRVSL